MNEDAEILVNGETVGYGLEGMLAALPRMLDDYSRCPRCEGYEATYHTFEGQCSVRREDA